ncbi:MAG: DUF1735 domain-containing protein [Agriterribacter sp.]
MKMHLKYFSYLLLIALLALGFDSCIKDKYEPLGDTGTARVKLRPTPTNIQYFSPFSETKVIDLITVTRDEVKSADVQETYTVTVANIADSITAYNDAEGTSYEAFPDSIYTLVTGKGVEESGTSTYKVTFAPGVTSIPISVSVNGSKWDPSYSYAMYFKITDASGKEITSDEGESLAAISVKNTWDGVYEVTGTQTDVVNAALTNINDFLSSSNNSTGIEAPMQYELRTTGTAVCASYDNYFYGGYYKPITSADTYSSYGSFSPIFTFDPETNEIIDVTNYYGQPAGNTRYATLDPTGENSYDPVTKVIKVKYFMHQPSAVATAPYIRVSFDETWKYIGDRK